MKTKEEMALWDALAVDAVSRGHVAADSYRVTRGRWEDLVKARRALFAPPPAPVVVMERGKCGNCGEEISGTWDHYAAGAFTCHKAAPAPVASELPLTTIEREFPTAVANALATLRRESEGYAVHDETGPAEIINKVYRALEAWARSIPTTSGAQFPKARAALTTFRTMNHHHHQGSTLRGCNSSMIDAAIAELDAAQAVPDCVLEAVRIRAKELDYIHTTWAENMRNDLRRWLAQVEGE